jgi:hypothetical protein
LTAVEAWVEVIFVTPAILALAPFTLRLPPIPAPPVTLRAPVVDEVEAVVSVMLTFPRVLMLAPSYSSHKLDTVSISI